MFDSIYLIHLIIYLIYITQKNELAFRKSGHLNILGLLEIRQNQS